MMVCDSLALSLLQLATSPNGEDPPFCPQPMRINDNSKKKIRSLRRELLLGFKGVTKRVMGKMVRAKSGGVVEST